MIYKILRKTKGEIGNQAEVLSLHTQGSRIPYIPKLLLCLLIDNFNNPSEHIPAPCLQLPNRRVGIPCQTPRLSVVDSKSQHNLARYTERVQTQNDGEIRLFDLCTLRRLGAGSWVLEALVLYAIIIIDNNNTVAR